MAASRRDEWRRKRSDLLGTAAERLCNGEPSEGEAQHGAARRWSCGERLGNGSALVCSGRRWKSFALSRAAMEEKSTASRSPATELLGQTWNGKGMDKRSKASHGKGGAAKQGMAREEQSNERTREGPATDRCAEALCSSAMRRRERLRHCGAKQREATAKQSRGVQRRWTDTGSEGDALRGVARRWL